MFSVLHYPVKLVTCGSLIYQGSNVTVSELIIILQVKGIFDSVTALAPTEWLV